MKSTWNTLKFFVIRGVPSGMVLGIVVNLVMFLGSTIPLGEGILASLLFGVIYGGLLGLLTSTGVGLAVGALSLATGNRIILIAVAALLPVVLIFAGGTALFAGPMIGPGFAAIYVLLALLFGGIAYLYTPPGE